MGHFLLSNSDCVNFIQVDSEAVRWVAILYCNRAAAHMALQAYTEAVADCHQAITRDSDLSKAYLRRARAYGVRHHDFSAF